MTELTFHCTGQDVVWTNPGVYPLVAGSEEIYEAVFTFDEAWDGFHVLGVFENAQSKVVRTNVLLGGACQIPKEVLATPGDLYVGCLGTLENQKMPTVRITSLKINPGVRDDGSMYIEPAASLWEQMVENIEQIVAEHAITTIPARLTEYEKRTARTNIGAADEEEIADARIGYNQVQYEN